MSTSATYFVTGTNKGIGYALVKQLSSNPLNKVLATVRDPSRATKLQDLAKANPNISILTLDLADENSIKGLPKQVSEVTDVIDVFISNAVNFEGVDKVLNVSRQAYLDSYIVNSLAPIEILKNIIKFFEKSTIKKLLFVSTISSSMNGGPQTNMGAYSQSKAANNFTAYNLSFELAPENFTVLSVHPGAVRSETALLYVDYLPEETRNYFFEYAITPDQSAEYLLKLLDNSDETFNGKLFNYDGEQLSY